MLADEKRRVAVRRFADARRAPTGESRARGGPSSAAATRATIGPRKLTAVTRKSAVSSDVAAAVAGETVVVETVNSGTAPASARNPTSTDEALCAGASGFVLKDDPPEQLIDAIRIGAGGDALLSPAITKRVIKQFTRISQPTPPIATGAPLAECPTASAVC